jgi:hypothetical protein
MPYNPDQPRAPAGSEDGGQWVRAYRAGARLYRTGGGPISEYKDFVDSYPKDLRKAVRRGFADELSLRPSPLFSGSPRLGNPHVNPSNVRSYVLGKTSSFGPKRR